MREPATSGVGGGGEDCLACRIVERVVESRDHSRSIAEGWMGGHVLDAFTVDPDFAIIAEALEIFRARERATPASGVAHALLQELVFYHGSSVVDRSELPIQD